MSELWIANCEFCEIFKDAGGYTLIYDQLELEFIMRKT